MPAQPTDSPLLIAHVIHRLQVGGLENGLVNIINRLPTEQFQHVIICLTDSSEFADRIAHPVRIVELHKQEGHDLGLYWRLFKTYRKFKPDVVHTRNLATLEAQLPAWLARIPFRIHGLHGWDTQDMYGENTRYHKLYKLIGTLVHRFIPLSDNLENYLLEKIGVSPTKITNICNGVDTERFFPATDKAVARQIVLPDFFEGVLNDCEAGTQRDGQSPLILIGTVGRLEVVKDQTNLLEAFILLLTEHPELKNRVRLMLVGEGTLREKIQRRIHEVGFAEHILMAGAREDVPELMRAMDIFVLPSKAEGISNTILEAMASGLPVIATDVGGNSQLVTENETGFLVAAETPSAIAKRLHQYCVDPILLQAHSKAARIRAAQQFSLQKMVDNYAAIYQQAAIFKE